MALPNFLIVGASKSGTTSLFHYLAQHPDICMAKNKEPKFFIDCEREVKDLAGYEALFSHCGGERARGEATPAYLYDPEAPEKIKQTLCEVRIIILLRNPADMAFALWRHVSRFGRRGEKLPFEKALEEEPRRMKDPEFLARRDTWPGHFFYFSRVQYFGQVKRYFDTFGRENVQVHIFEDFKSDPMAVCKEVFRFLGVDEVFHPILGSHNVGVELRHRGLGKLAGSPPGWLKVLGAIVPSGARDGLVNVIKWLNTKPPPRLTDSTRKMILDKSRQDIDRLGELIGRDLSFWYKSKPGQGGEGAAT